MKFEELESLWTSQASVIPVAVDLAEVKRRLAPEMRRRGRMLGYELAMALLGLLALPALTVANALHDPARYGTAAQWLHASCQFAVIALLLVQIVQRVRRHRALRRQPVGSLREMTVVSLASLEAEMRDYRWRQPILGLLLASIMVAVVFAGLRHGWEAGLTAGLSSGALLAVVVAGFWYHYRVNLRPAWVRQKEMLRALE
ncbi:MAG TPA: hypothetical protein VHN79_03430 [Lacunisphaera sp.]|nr:hypothetical protein [Lacunisphaera sp.]